jgi:pimeloyl-ACP methyl ester carboxylesterase
VIIMAWTSEAASTFSRRSVLKRGGALGLGASSLAATLAPSGFTKTAAAADPAPATFVLVPGQWTGAFVWHTVAPLLRAAGHEAYAVTCTGLGERVHLASPAIDLDDFITDVVNVLEYEDLHDVTLVGHSFSGMVITGVAERVPERLKQLVYLDASVPADGQNSYDADTISEEASTEWAAADIAGGMEAGTPGYRPVYPGVEEWLRGAIRDPAEAEWFIAKLVPHPLLTDQQPVKLGNPAAAALPRAFILCTADKDLTADPQTNPYVLTVERVRSDPNWRVIELDDNHMVNLNDPQATAEALLALV